MTVAAAPSRPSVGRDRDRAQLVAVTWAWALAVPVLPALIVAGLYYAPVSGLPAMAMLIGAGVAGVVAALFWFCFFVVLNLRHAPRWFDLGTTLRGLGWQLMSLLQLLLVTSPLWLFAFLAVWPTVQ